jgi:hypothetical protein
MKYLRTLRLQLMQPLSTKVFVWNGLLPELKMKGILLVLVKKSPGMIAPKLSYVFWMFGPDIICAEIHVAILMTLFVSELVHTLMHIFVLFDGWAFSGDFIKGIWKFDEVPEIEKRLYFATDLATSLITYFFYANSTSTFYVAMVLIHGLVHMGIQVFWGTEVSRTIIRIAEGSKREKMSIFIPYIIGTLQDIVTHSMNTWILLFASLHAVSME